jgi:hypothetical protein
LFIEYFLKDEDLREAKRRFKNTRYSGLALVSSRKFVLLPAGNLRLKTLFDGSLVSIVVAGFSTWLVDAVFLEGWSLWKLVGLSNNHMNLGQYASIPFGLLD